MNFSCLRFSASLRSDDLTRGVTVHGFGEDGNGELPRSVAVGIRPRRGGLPY
jgi:hypothetical protein